MNRLTVVALGAVAALSACDFGVKTCRNGEACPAGSVCDPGGSGFCVQGDGGVSGGGGGMTGGGGGATGGGSGGGGGGGGGSMCGPCNGVGQECVANVCTDVALEMVADTPTSVVGALPVDVTFHVRRQGGAPVGAAKLPMMVTVTPAGGSGLVTSAGLPLTDGGYSFTARSMAPNSNASVQVDLSFPPATGADVTASVMVPVDTRPSVATVDLVELKTMDAGARGAEWAFPTSTPVVTATTPRRDDTLVVRVSSDDVLMGGALAFAVADGGTQQVPTRPVGCSAACPRTTCSCFEVDGWALPMPAVTDTFALRFSGQNARGIAYDGGVPGMGFSNANGVPNFALTRLRWKSALAGTPPIRATPALDTQGTMYFGTQLTSTLGALYALKADGKAPNATWQTGINVGSVSSVAVSPQEGLVYFTASDGTQGGYISARTTDGGVPSGGGATQCKGSSTSQRANTAMALYDNGTRLTGIAAMSASGTTFGFCSWNPSLPDSFVPKETNDNGPTAPSDSIGVSNLFVSNTGAIPELNYVAHLSGADGGVLVVRRMLNTAAGAYAIEGKTNLTAAQDDNGVIPGSLTDFGASSRLFLSTTQGVFVVDPGSGVQSVSGGSVAGKAVTDSLGARWLGLNLGLFLVDASNAPDGRLATSSQTVGAPVLGANTSGLSDRLYMVTKVANLVVAPQQGVTSEPGWVAPMPLGSSTVSASPTLDCNRYGPTATARTNTGVLYVATNNGEVVSIVVDSRKLDAMAKWPKFQKDIFNSGNTTLNLADGCP